MDCASKILCGHQKDHTATSKTSAQPSVLNMEDSENHIAANNVSIQPSTSNTNTLGEKGLNIQSLINSAAHDTICLSQSDNKLFGSNFHINSPKNCTFNITFTK